MGDANFHVVPADMTHDQGQWSAASEALGRAVSQADKADTVEFGSFAQHIKSIFTTAANTTRANLKAGETALAGMATNVANNSGQYTSDDKDAGGRVRGAGAGSGSGAGNSSGPGGHGGKGEDHYAGLLGPTTPMPTDPKDPEVTFDRHVDPDTGEVTWTRREMKPGEATAIDGRDVERIPQRADRVVVTMVDGEPQITYVDKDAQTLKQVEWAEAGVRPAVDARVVAGSGAVEPSAQGPLEPVAEWNRPLPEGADFAVVEVRDGEPHLVFLDVEGGEVHEIADHTLATPVPVAAPAPEPVAVPDAASQPTQQTQEA